MEFFLVKLVALLRPLASVEFAATIFEIVGIGLFGLLVAALLANSALRKSSRLSAVDAAIVTFTLWCCAIYAIYFEAAEIKEVAKLLVPLLSYVAVKNVVRDRSQYEALVRWALIGFSVPIVLSTVMNATGSGVDYVSYWTGVSRWRGAYEGSHSLGHSMTLFLMMLVLYANLSWFNGISEKKRGPIEKFVFGGLGVAALYCLYLSQVRTAVVGLVTFVAVYLYFVNRKWLVIGTVAVGALAIMTLPVWLPELLPEFAMREKGIKVETMELGSGRPTMWLNDLIVFADAPLDQQLAGVGIGNRGARGGALRDDADYVIYGHNDWLEMLTQTGIVGLLLFAWIQVAILRAILRMTGSEKYLFLSMFFAVVVMMVISNSYAWRIQVSQLYYMMLVYIETQRLPATEGAVQRNFGGRRSLSQS